MWLYVSDLNVLGESPRHSMCLLQCILYRISLLNDTDNEIDLFGHQ